MFEQFQFNFSESWERFGAKMKQDSCIGDERYVNLWHNMKDDNEDLSHVT